MKHNMRGARSFRHVFTIAMMLVICSTVRYLHAQEIVTWDVLAYMKQVNAGIINANGVWAASSGGAFFYNFTTGTYQSLTKANGLGGSPVTAIIADKNGNIWLGCENGQIDIINATGTVVIKKITNIRDSHFLDKKITAFAIAGDTVYVAAGFGISVINSQKFSFIDTYFTLSDATLAKSVGALLKTDRIFGALGDGIVVQNKNALILNEPSAWKYYSQVGGLPINGCKRIIQYKGKTLAATGNGLGVLQDTVWQQYIPDFAGIPLKDILYAGDSLIILTKLNEVFSIRDGQVRRVYDALNSAVSSFIGINNGIYFASSIGVFNVLDGGDIKVRVPGGLPERKLYNLYADASGNLWVATGKDAGGAGLFRFTNNNWTVYNTTNSIIKTNDFVNVTAMANGDVYTGTWGSGLLKIQNLVPTIMLDAYNTPLVGIPSFPKYLVIGGLSTDSKQNLWVLNYYPGDKSLFAVLNGAGTWTLVQHPSFLIQEGYTHLVIDDNDTKWFVYNSGKALYYFNENGSFTTTADDKLGSVSNAGNLAGKSINAVVVDKKNELWVGTEAGVYVLSDTRSVLTANPGVFNALYPLRGFKVNAIAVDGINRKWIGTNRGLLLVSADGNTIIQHYLSTDSPLLSDDIEKLAIDLKNGIVYAGSAEGIVALHTVAVEPQKDYSAVKIYPNPVILHNETLVTFDGLVKETEIKILDASGKLVKYIVTPGGGKGYWNGLDAEGKLVASGVYFVVLFDKEGTISSVEKLAVIRK